MVQMVKESFHQFVLGFAYALHLLTCVRRQEARLFKARKIKGVDHLSGK
jgi:hypothetical protein